MFDRFSLVGCLRALVAVLLLLVAGAIGVAVNGMWSVLSAARDELAGLEPVGALLKLLTVSAEHRGMSAGYLAGNAEFAPRREAKEREVEAALKEAEAALAIYDQPELVASRDSLRNSWQSLAPAEASRQLTGPLSFVQHHKLVQQELQLLDEVASASTLALDPQAAS